MRHDNFVLTYNLGYDFMTFIVTFIYKVMLFFAILKIKH